jgi:NMD protein affecting ribosome stability and mRNA decay
MRASATTILIQSIPRKWLTVPALDALYDVFPGGIKDIWINRNYDALQEKVNKRTNIARKLEAAETNLVIACTKQHMKMEEARAKKEGQKKKSRKELTQVTHTKSNSNCNKCSKSRHRRLHLHPPRDPRHRTASGV